ncbi:MAG: EpsG family protein, partial [Muribaculaceae bacterium]|nr:EpsG family protein [Muribaculaceae bacterium]
VQLIMNTIMTVCVSIFLYQNCKNVFVGMFFFLIIQWLYFSTEVMRESVAIGIFLLNFKNIEKKRWIRYYLFSILSLSFHYSAILIWFIPFAKYLRVNWLYIIGCIGMLSVTPLVENLNNMIHLGVVSSKISTYVNQADVGTIFWRIGEFIKTGIPALLCLVLYYFARKKNILQPYILLQFMFCCGAFAIPIIFQRFTNYTTLFVTVALANYVTDKKIAFPLRATLIGVICITQSYYYYSMVHTWIPYESIFDPVKVPKREEFNRIIW